MKSRIKLMDFFYRLFISVIINYLFIGLMVESLGVKLNKINILIILVTSLLFVSFWRAILKKPSLLLPLVGFFILINLYIKFYQREVFNDVLLKVYDFIDWSFRFLSKLTFIHMDYFNILLGLIVIFSSLVISILVFNKKGLKYLLGFGTVIFLYRWFLFSELAMTYYIFYITIILSLYSYNKYFKLEEQWKKRNIIVSKNMKKNWILYSFIVCLVMVLISVIAPRDIEPITWRWLDNTMQERFPFLTEWRNNQKVSYSFGAKMKFDLSNTDFQGEYKRLGGPIEESNVLLMKVKAKTSEELYLKGSVKDLYTGSYWKSTWDSFSNEKSSVVNSLYEGIEGELNWVQVKHENFVTSSIFSCYIPKLVKIEDGRYRINKEGEMYRDKLILKGDSYIVYYVKPYLSNNSISNKDTFNDGEDIKYLQLPNKLPKRVVDLSKEITKGINGDYNKVRAIERYLKENYNYTLAPEETPYNRDFVDYFLFDLREGYCSYFASSLAIMTRSIGIPSRYIEGFKASDKVNDEYLVYSNNGHAWTEVYIEGQGWMVFEATPGFDNITYEEKKEIKKEADKSDNSSNNNLKNKEDKLRYLEEMSDSNISLMGNNIDYNNDSNYSAKNIIKYIATLLLLIIVIVICIFLYNFLKLKRTLKSLENSNNSKKIVENYRYIINLLNILGFKKLEGETTTEFSDRLKLDIYNKEYNLKEVTMFYNKARYSREVADSTEVTIVKEYLKSLELMTKRKIGRIKFLYYKYIVMGIYNK